ncbi:MAG TPA: class I SAM-dependent methyltransferase [Methylomirabilota bacterium]|nr:class I SAM-dependent methyltransferase [Methylomirabilota bacterium]
MITSSFQCRSCQSSRGELALDLGIQPLANNLLRTEDLGKPEPRFPLRLAVCRDCWLMQIMDIVPPVDLFSEYLYFSSFSDAMLAHAKAAAERHTREFGLGPESFVVEIASNDGYLLRNFQAAGVPCLGFEPARNIARVSREKGIETLEEFFTTSSAERLASGRKADLILGNNVFAHAPDPNDFVQGLRRLLKPHGRVVIEFPYGVDFVEKNEFDTIYHEHVFYFTLIPLMPLFERHGLEIYHAERLTIHGGSLRIYAAHRGTQKRTADLQALLDAEQKLGVNTTGFYKGFADAARAIRGDLLALIAKLKAEGKRVAAYGASAKGSTLLNFCGFPAGSLDFVADRSSYKQGRLTPGAHIPILAPGELLAQRPDYTLLLTWNFKEEILHQQAEYRAAGGKFIIPIPRVEVV